MAISDGKSLEFILDEEKGKEKVEEEKEEEEEEEEEEKDARGWLGLLEISKNCCLNLDDEK